MDELAAFERRFRREGLPLFIEDYSASEDVWTRAAPLLALVFLGEVLGAVDLRWSALANLGAVAAALAITLGSVAFSNQRRGRSASALPQNIGRAELVGFVAIPAALPLLFGGQTTSAMVTALGNLALLAVLYGVIGYGVAFIVVWTGRRLADQLVTAAALLARAVPLLTLFSVVLFLTTEVWQVFADMDDGRLVAACALLVGVGALFLLVRLPREVAALERQVGEGPSLDRRQRVNVGLVLFISQALQVLLVTLAVGVFFVAFGLLAIRPGTVQTWVGHGPHTTVALGGIVLYAELLRVAVTIAAFSGLYYAIAVLTDATYREEFLDELTEEMRGSFGARARYLALREA